MFGPRTRTVRIRGEFAFRFNGRRRNRGLERALSRSAARLSGMTSAASPIAADRPAHYRLSTETWELILKEYREGATAPFLARKWRVSEHAIRKRCTQHGATKREWGDAQAIGQALAREAELEEARRNAQEAVAARLFAGVDLPDDEGDAAALGLAATLASGRAMKGRLWNEAKALTGLAESYARPETRARTVPVPVPRPRARSRPEPAPSGPRHPG